MAPPERLPLRRAAVTIKPHAVVWRDGGEVALAAQEGPGKPAAAPACTPCLAHLPSSLSRAVALQRARWPGSFLPALTSPAWDQFQLCLRLWRRRSEDSCRGGPHRCTPLHGLSLGPSTLSTASAAAASTAHPGNWACWWPDSSCMHPQATGRRRLTHAS